MNAVTENQDQAPASVPARQKEFLSSYRGVSHYRVQGVAGRVSVHHLNAADQSFYGDDDMLLVGTVIEGIKPVSDEILAIFQAKQDELCAIPEKKVASMYVRRLTTAKWYPALGWVRCDLGV